MPRRRVPRVVLVGDIGGADRFHVGDEAMFECDLALLRRLLPEASFTAVSDDPDHTSALYDVDAATWRDARRVAKRADLLVVTGGGNLNSSFPEHLARRLELARATHRAGGTVVLLGQMLGPYLTDDDATRLRELLGLCAFIGVRSEDSAAVAERVGVTDARVVRSVDDAWLEGAEIASDRLPGLPDDAYSVVTVHPDARILDSSAMKSLAHQLGRVARETETELVLVPHCNAPEGLGGSSDLVVAFVLGRMLDAADVPHRSLAVLEPAVVGAITRRSALVISTRYHPVVFAMSGCVPALALWADEYVHSKQRGALESAGLGRWMLSIDDAIERGIEPAVGELWDRRHEIQEWLGAHAPLLEGDLRERDTALAECLRGVGLPVGPNPRPAVQADAITTLGEPPVPQRAWSSLATPGPGTARRTTVIDRVRVEVRADHAALVARVQGPELEATEVRFRVHDAALTDRLDASATPLLSTAVLLAARTGTDLAIDAPVDAAALTNVEETTRLYRDWWGWRTPSVDATGVERVGEPGAGVGLWFSRGVDSSDTLVRSFAGTLVEDGVALRVTHLLGLDWIDPPFAMERAAETWAETHATATSLGLPLLRFTTDVRDVLDRFVGWDLTHGAVLAGLGLLVGPVLGTVIVSGVGIGEGQRPHGTHPRLDPLHSTAGTRVVHAGLDGRAAKVARLVEARWPLEALKVCWQVDTPRNCGRCVKCLATMTTLAAVDALDRCDRFDGALSSEAVRTVARGPDSLHVHEDSVSDAIAAAATFDPDLADAWREVDARLRRDAVPAGDARADP